MAAVTTARPPLNTAHTVVHKQLHASQASHSTELKTAVERKECSFSHITSELPLLRVTCVQPIDRLDMHASMAATCRSEAVQLCAAEAGALSRLFMACMPSTHARTERVNTVARLPHDGDALHDPMPSKEACVDIRG